MAYDYLGLLNDVNRRLNEVELTTSNFANANGEYAMVKDALNASLRYINQHEYQWPFNHAEAEETLTVGTVRYSFPSDAKMIDFNTFRIKRSETFNTDTKRLRVLSYEEYLDKYIDYEYNTSVGIRALPEYVFRTPNEEFGLIAPPNNAYELVYEYYRLPVDLINATDVPSVPEQFRYIIVNGAMSFAYLFRGEGQESAMMQQRFEDEIKQMRSIYINRYDYLRSTVISQSNSSYNTIRIS